MNVMMIDVIVENIIMDDIIVGGIIRMI